MQYRNSTFLQITNEDICEQGIIHIYTQTQSSEYGNKKGSIILGGLWKTQANISTKMDLWRG